MSSRPTLVPRRPQLRGQLAEVLGLPAEALPRRHSRQYWDDLLDKVRALAEPDR